MSGPFVLAVETATADMEVALADATGPLAEVSVRRGRRHVESLHPAIETVCREAGVAMRELALVAVDIGPGLFTGLRVGVTAAKLIALALDLPLVAATSLEILAAGAGSLVGPRTRVVPVVDMRRGEVAWRWGGEIHLTKPGDVAPAIASDLGAAGATAGVDVLLVGDGARAHGEAILAGAGASAPPSLGAPEGAGGAGSAGAGSAGAGSAGAGWLRVAGGALPAPPARALAALAFERLAAGDTADPVTLVPLYLREADAAINWESRPGRRPASGDA